MVAASSGGAVVGAVAGLDGAEDAEPRGIEPAGGAPGGGGGGLCQVRCCNHGCDGGGGGEPPGNGCGRGCGSS